MVRMVRHPLVHRSRGALAFAALVAAMLASMMQAGTAHAEIARVEQAAR
jgi:TRAP-type C4-dicarboxylate transport system permease large subunit